MPTPEFPQELVDYIIDHVHDSTETLLACALVCRSWLPSARFHLFSDITISESHTIPRILQGLSMNDTLPGLVRSLALIGNETSGHFASVFHGFCFTSLTTFEVWDIIPDSVDTDFILLLAISMPNLVCLALHDCLDLPFSYLNRLLTVAPLSMKELDLSHIFITQIPDTNPLESLIDTRRVSSLILGHSNALDWIFHPKLSFNFGFLTSLELSRDFECLDVILPHLTSTLEHLSLTGSMVDAAASDISDVTDIALSRLTRLTVSMSRMALHLVMQWISKGNIQPQHLTFIFFYEELEDRLSLHADFDDDDIAIFGWNDIDRFLDGAKSLQRLEIAGEYENTADRAIEEIERTKQTFCELLPRLFSKGHLVYM
ncbi:hypothetical protein C8J56DRAFT_245777 [Mycena floridula]|nr:hypothetical protein C8J56DRAFT_245777 [Mycena floridula]